MYIVKKSRVVFILYHKPLKLNVKKVLLYLNKATLVDMNNGYQV